MLNKQVKVCLGLRTSLTFICFVVVVVVVVFFFLLLFSSPRLFLFLCLLCSASLVNETGSYKEDS